MTSISARRYDAVLGLDDSGALDMSMLSIMRCLPLLRADHLTAASPGLG
jgi:hypothetical protein